MSDYRKNWAFAETANEESVLPLYSPTDSTSLISLAWITHPFPPFSCRPVATTEPNAASPDPGVSVQALFNRKLTG
jgi:hypothetical protein